MSSRAAGNDKNVKSTRPQFRESPSEKALRRFIIAAGLLMQYYVVGWVPTPASMRLSVRCAAAPLHILGGIVKNQAKIGYDVAFCLFVSTVVCRGCMTLVHWRLDWGQGMLLDSSLKMGL